MTQDITINSGHNCITLTPGETQQVFDRVVQEYGYPQARAMLAKSYGKMRREEQVFSKYSQD